MENKSPRSPARARAARARILDALVLVVHERGYAATTVTEVCARAGVARGTFYEAFESLQDCFLAMMDCAHLSTREVIQREFASNEQWQDGLRAALATLLRFFDAHPHLARVWLIETLAAGDWALRRRELHTAELTSMILRRWPTPDRRLTSQLTAASAMESLLAMIRTHLLTSPELPTTSLLASMMSLITIMYLGPEEAAAERMRCQAHLKSMETVCTMTDKHRRPEAVKVPHGLLHPRAHRVRGCLQHLVSNPQASNRQIAAAAGIGRDDQTSTMLARLEHMGLLVKRQGRPGAANSWSLSPYGQRVAVALQAGA